MASPGVFTNRILAFLQRDARARRSSMLSSSPAANTNRPKPLPAESLRIEWTESPWAGAIPSGLTSMYLHLDLGLAGFFHSWPPASLQPVRRFSSSALPQGTCASPKSICRLGLTEANVHFSACLETTGGASRSLTIHADQ